MDWSNKLRGDSFMLPTKCCDFGSDTNFYSILKDHNRLWAVAAPLHATMLIGEAMPNRIDLAVIDVADEASMTDVIMITTQGSTPLCYYLKLYFVRGAQLIHIYPT